MRRVKGRIRGYEIKNEQVSLVVSKFICSQLGTIAFSLPLGQHRYVEDYLFPENRRSKYRRTPITLAASTSIAGLLSMVWPRSSFGATCCGFGRVCSLGSQLPSSS